MRKVLQHNEKTKKYLDKLPKMHIVALWANWGVMSFPFSGKYKVKNGISYPLVWDYDDHNGTEDNWYLRPIDWVTTGFIITWTQSEGAAERIADALNLASVIPKQKQEKE